MLCREDMPLVKVISNLKLSSDKHKALYDTYTLGQLAYACTSKLLEMHDEAVDTSSVELRLELNRNLEALVKLLEEPR